MTTTLPHSNDTTSRAAAISARGRTRAARVRLVAFIADQGAKGATDEEIANGCPEINDNAVRIRRGECHARKLITDAGSEKRPTSSGSPAQVWHVTALGLKALGRHPVGWHVPDAEAKR